MAKVLIIGGGVAGLSAGIHARKAGFETVICESHSAAGGNLTGWQRGEYHIDNCIHWLTGTNPASSHYALWQELGALEGNDVYQADTLYTFEEGGRTLSLHKDVETIRKEMLALAPEDEREINAFIHAVNAVRGIMGTAGENSNEKSTIFEKFRDVPLLARYYLLSTGELASRFTNPTVQKFIRCLLGEDFAAIALLVVFATFTGKNGGLPKGGSRAMAKKIAERFISLGGELLLNKEAVEVISENGRATAAVFSDGTKIAADYIVLTIDPKIAFPNLLKTALPKTFQRRYADPRFPRFSSYHCAFSCDSDKLPFRGDFIFKLPDRYQRELKTEYLILREFSHEPSFAPQGKTVLQSMTFCDETDSKAFIELKKNDPAAYKAEKARLIETVKFVVTKKFPFLAASMRPLDVWTPASYHRYVKSEMGSYMSFLLPSKTLPLRVNSRVDSFKNVYLATQWQVSPGGLPTAATLGKHAIERIQQAERGLLPFRERRFFLHRKRQREVN